MENTARTHGESLLIQSVLSVLEATGYPSIVLDGVRTGEGRAWWTEYLNSPLVDVESIAEQVCEAATRSAEARADAAETVLALGRALGFPPLCVELDNTSYYLPEGEQGWQIAVESALSDEAVGTLAEDAAFLRDLLSGREPDDRAERVWCWYTARRLGFPSLEMVDADAEAWQAFLLLADEDALAQACYSLAQLRLAQPALAEPPEDAIPYGAMEQEAVTWLIENSSAEVQRYALEYLVASETTYPERLRHPDALEGVVRLLGRLGANVQAYRWAKDCPDLTPVLWHLLVLLIAERMGYPEVGEGVWHIARGSTPWTETIRHAERRQVLEWFKLLRAHERWTHSGVWR